MIERDACRNVCNVILRVVDVKGLTCVYMRCRPGLGTLEELYALQVLTLALMYHFLNRVKLWEKFSSRLLIPNLPKAVNLVIIALVESAIMVGFMAFMTRVTFQGVPVLNLLVYIYLSLQCTQSTAEAIQKFTPGDQGLDVALAIALICNGLIMWGTIFILSLWPSLVAEVGLFYGMWANIALIYLLVKLCEPAPVVPDPDPNVNPDHNANVNPDPTHAA